jgi:hypothetical protein
MPITFRGKKEYFLVYCALIDAARRRSTVTYQDLAVLVGLPKEGTWMGRALGVYLGEISEDEVKLHERPMLSAVAVNVSGKPGPGFFAFAKELGKCTSDEPMQQSAFWEAEREAVYRTWE